MPPSNVLRSLWSKTPVALRAAIVAFAILMIGQIPQGIFLWIGLRTTPAVPWFLFATAAWLWVFWSYLGGRGWPASTAATRALNLRGRRLSPSLWAWSLIAGGFGMACVLGIALLTGMVAALPDAAYEAPFDLSPYPVWTVAAFFLNIALTAGVVEEAAFRGYMLSMIERRHGWVVAIFATALLFYATHLSHAYATLAFAPFFALYSVLHGVLVWMTRSILPSVVIHVVGDFSILPIQYGVIEDPLGESVAMHVMFVLVCGATAMLAF
jgi:membrane protease YdiL (CAAX protease family)